MRKNQTPQEAAYIVRSVVGRQHATSTIPQRGEPIYDIESKSLVVGDGETPLAMLPAIDNVVTANDGRLYTVAIDSRGNVTSVLPFDQPAVINKENVVMHLQTPCTLFQPMSLN